MIKPLLSLLACVCLISPAKANANPADTLGAATIIHHSENAYAGIKTYLDSGKVLQTMYTRDIPNKTAKYFKTAYANTGDFNFEYYEAGRSNSLYTINRTDKMVKTWWGVTNQTKTQPDIKSALSAAVGVSSSASAIIPDLLLTADFKTNIYKTISKPTLEGTEMLGNLLCYKIAGTAIGDRKTTIWIAKTDFLIRKIETEYVVDPAKTAAFSHKIDSTMMARHSKDTAYLRKDSIRKAKMAKTEADIKHILPDYQPNMKAFNVKSTYLFFPYTLKKPNADLFKFRPNREIAL